MNKNVIFDQKRQRPNVSTTPIEAMGFWQSLPISAVQLKGKHCRKPHCRNGVVDTFRQSCHKEIMGKNLHRINSAP